LTQTFYIIGSLGLLVSQRVRIENS